MRGFVLAAGFGKRLVPLTEGVPKPLLPVGNIPLIGYALKLLAYHGITEVAVNLHHLGRQLRDTLGDGSAYGVNITYSVEADEILGTGGGLKQMAEFLSETFLVLNSDIVIDLDLEAVIESHRRQNAIATMVLREDPRQEEFGLIEIDEQSRIRRILGQGPATGTSEQSFRPLMFTGVHVIEPRFLDYIPTGVNTCINRYGYSKALTNGEVINAHVAPGYWAEFGTPARFLKGNFDALAQKIALRHADPLSGFALSPKKDVAEVVRMGDDVQLGSGVTLLPPVILGDGARVGENATVGPFTVVGPKVSIGKEANVSRSVLTDGAKIEAGKVTQRVIAGRKGTIQVDEAALEVCSHEASFVAKNGGGSIATG